MVLVLLLCDFLILPVGVWAQDRPYPIFTADHLDTTMKILGPNWAGVRAALSDVDYQMAKQRLSRTREQLATTMTFWRDREREDAMGWLRAALTQLDVLDAALSVEVVESAVLDPIVARVTEYCLACHEVYREQVLTGQYELRLNARP